MDEEKLLELFFYMLPAIVIGLIAYYFFRMHIKNEGNRREFLLQKDLQKELLPIRLKAYERMTLFLERINPSKLLLRIVPKTSNKAAYEVLLIRHIEDEFDHNLSQQIYMSDECWNIIKTAKNATIQLVRKTNMSDKVDSANKLREVILSDSLDKISPSVTALAFIKKEMRSFG